MGCKDASVSDFTLFVASRVKGRCCPIRHREKSAVSTLLRSARESRRRLESRLSLNLQLSPPMASSAARTALRTATRASTPRLAAAPALPAAFRPYSSSPSPSPSSSSSPSSNPTSTSRPTPTPQPTNLPGSNLPGASKYSPLTVSVVTKLAKLFGYHSTTSTAIRTTSDYYDRCAERGEIEAPFFYEGSSFFPFLSPFLLLSLDIGLTMFLFSFHNRPLDALNTPPLTHEQNALSLPRSKPGSPSPRSTSGSSPSASAPSPPLSVAPTFKNSSTTCSSTSNSACAVPTPSPKPA